MGPKASAVSASECHEISEGVIELIDEIDRLRSGVGECLQGTVDVRPQDAPAFLEGLRKSLYSLVDSYSGMPGPMED